MSENEEILRELSLTNVEELCTFYSAYQDEAPHVYSFLKNCIDWEKKQQGGKRKYIEIFAPNGEWKPDGSFISLAVFPWKHVFLYTIDPSFQRLGDALKKTNCIDFVDVLHYAVYEKFTSFIDKIMRQRGLNKTFHDDTHIWELNRQEAILRNPQLPKEFYFAKLNPENAVKVNYHWPYKLSFSEPYVRTLIEMNGGYGVFTSDTHNLVAWVLKSQIGQLALLQTIDGYQRKGLAAAVINKMAHEIAANGCNVIGTINVSNTASQQLFSKLGFKKTKIYSYFSYT